MKGQHAEAWRLARILANAKKGAQRKWGSAPLTSFPTSAQTIRKFKLHPLDGGACAVPTRVENILGVPSPGVVISEQNLRDAQSDFDEFCTALRTAGTRKGTLKGETPSELIRIACLPQITYKTRKSKSKHEQHIPISFVPAMEETEAAATSCFDSCFQFQKLKPNNSKSGIGSKKHYAAATAFTDTVVDLFTVIRATCTVPVQARTNVGFYVHKRVMPHFSESTIAEGPRTVHSYPPFFKAYFKARFAPLSKSPAPDCFFGCISERRREEAICVQLVNMCRLASHNVSFAMRFFDCKNTFNCPRSADISNLCDEAPSVDDAQFFK